MNAMINDALIPLNLGDHRVHFSEVVKGNQIYLSIDGRSKLKDALNVICRGLYGGEVVKPRAYLRLTVKMTGGAKLDYVIRYTVKTVIGKGKYTMEEKEALFHTDASREEIIHFGDRFVDYFMESDWPISKSYMEQYQKWAHPTLEDIAEKLTPEQKEEAARLLLDRFPEGFAA